LMVAGLGVSAFGEVKSMEAQQKQLQARQSMANLQAQNERLDQVRQARIRQAQIIQAGATQGAGESSAVTGGAQAVTGQAESNIQGINQQSGLVNSIFDQQQNEINAKGIESLGSNIFALGGKLMDSDTQAGIKKTYNDIFGD